MPAPQMLVLADARYGKRQVVKFGGLPVPIIGGTQGFIDLMDGVSWFLDDKKNGIEIKTDHKLVSAPYLYRAKSVVQSEDFLPATVTLDMVYDESSGIPLQQAVAPLYASGAQYLTFDNATGLIARMTNVLNRRMRVTAAPYLWEAQLEFVGYEPWWRDLASTTLGAVALAGSAGAGSITNFNITYAGSIFSEPVFVLFVPNTNAAPISQLVLLNQSNVGAVEQVTISFVPALAAGTQWTVTIDSGGLTITDQNGVQYDWTGSFPLLYPPAGTVNSFKATLITTSGASAGVTLTPTWTNRWAV